MIYGKNGLRVLLLRLRSLGDTVLMTPLLSTVKRVPGCRLAVAVESPYHEVLEGNPHIDDLFVLDRGRHDTIERLRAVRAIRAFRPDIVIDLHGGTTSAWMSFFSGAKKRVGYRSSRNAFLYNVKVPESRTIWEKDRLHTVEHQLSPLKYLGFPVEPLAPVEVLVSPDEKRTVRERLEALAIRGDFILVHPAAAFDTKQWPGDRFAELARRLDELGFQLVLTAGPGQLSLLQELRKLGTGRAQYLDPLPLRQFAALASLARLYVGNDTGATHIAAAMGTRIVAIFGSSDDKVWYPWNVEHQVVRQELPCVPCSGYDCALYKEPLCIRSVKVEAVVQAVRTLYGIHEQIQAD